jgi:hypothetical protein
MYFWLCWYSDEQARHDDKAVKDSERNNAQEEAEEDAVDERGGKGQGQDADKSCHPTQKNRPTDLI